jgi:hypothetical protein
LFSDSSDELKLLVPDFLLHALLIHSRVVLQLLPHIVGSVEM